MTSFLLTCLFFIIAVDSGITVGNSVIKVPIARMSEGDSNYVTFDDVKGLENNKTVLLIDVRQPEELTDTGTIPGSINIPLADVESTLKNTTPEEFLSKYNRSKPQLDTPLIFSCRSGRRSESAQNIALSLGFSNVRNYRGGWLDWEANINAN